MQTTSELAQIFWQCDPLSKFILILFFIFSLYWMVTFLLGIGLLNADVRNLKKLENELDQGVSIDELILKYTNNFFCSTYLLRKIYSYVKTQQGHESVINSEKFEEFVYQTTDDLQQQAESFWYSLLPIIIAVSPLLGLFGTIWGLMQSFTEIGKAHAADLAVIAPGIAVALMTTLGGLLVAIPALVAYNILVIALRRHEHKLSQLAYKISVNSGNFLSVRGYAFKNS